MTTPETTFTGMNPADYDGALGPMFFEPYAVDLSRRLRVGAKASILEGAAGTGILTKELLKILPSDGRLTATDIHEGMLAVAQRNVPADPRVTWQIADACSFPFPDQSFDAIVCQFGLMFFPDKPAALRTARRLLKPSGVFLFNVWGSLADNPIPRTAHETIGSFFPDDPPQFYTIPFGFHDRPLIEDMLRHAGFASINSEVVTLEGVSESAERAARGLVFGTPILTAIEERGGVAAADVMQAVAARLAREGGDRPMRLPMRALVFRATP